MLVYNFVREGTLLLPHDECDFKGFDLQKVWMEKGESRHLAKVSSSATTEPDFASVKQFTRLTMVFKSGGFIHQMVNVGAKPGDKSIRILNSYDLIAIRPQDNESLAEQAFTKSDADIISLDLS